MRTDGWIVLSLSVLAVAAVPRWPHSRNWSYAPSKWLLLTLGLVLIGMALGWV